MKFLLDQNISFRVVQKLKEHFPEVQSVKDNNLINASDLQIWEFAQSKGYTIITFDEDFYNIQLLKGFPPKIIWFKIGNLTKQQFVDFLIAQKQMVNAFIQDEHYKNDGCLELFLIRK
jgi:predicted nuclease of predicted toxin-antitoxin system